MDHRCGDPKWDISLVVGLICWNVGEGFVWRTAIELKSNALSRAEFFLYVPRCVLVPSNPKLANVWEVIENRKRTIIVWKFLRYMKRTSSCRVLLEILRVLSRQMVLLDLKFIHTELKVLEGRGKYFTILAKFKIMFSLLFGSTGSVRS